MRDYITPLFRKSNAKDDPGDPDSAFELINQKNWKRLLTKCLNRKVGKYF